VRRSAHRAVVQGFLKQILEAKVEVDGIQGKRPALRLAEMEGVYQ
jgi:hypothetical protein